MDKNTFTGLFLMLVVIVGSFFIMRPSEEEIKKERALQDSIANAKINAPLPEKQNISLDSASRIASEQDSAFTDSTLLASPFGLAKIKNEGTSTLENELIKVTISNKGGKVQSVEIKGDKSYDGDPLILFDEQGNKFGLIFNAAGSQIHTDDLYFTPSASNLTVSKGDSATMSFRLAYGQNQYIEYIYSLKGDSYNLGLTINTIGMQQVVAPDQHKLILNWEATLKQKKKI